jgi:hypothetical protein
MSQFLSADPSGDQGNANTDDRKSGAGDKHQQQQHSHQQQQQQQRKSAHVVHSGQFSLLSAEATLALPKPLQATTFIYRTFSVLVPPNVRRSLRSSNFLI